MKILQLFAFAVAAILSPITAVATAQIVPVGPFTGANSEAFDVSPSGHITCYTQRILGGTADLCAAGGGELVVAGASHCSCVLQPLGLYHALAFNPGHLRISFGTPAVRFGCFFALNCNVADGRADFMDTNGALIASMPLTVPSDCTYHWQGFEVLSGPPIGSVELYSNLFSGGVLHIDNLEANYQASVTTYCTAKGNSLNCLPRIECDGTPTAGATSGWVVRAVNVRPGGIAGLLLYTPAGARAAAPFQCGTLCVGPVGIRRSAPVQSTFSGQLCDGSYSIDMNAFAAGVLGGNPSAALSLPGTMVQCQWWGRDQGFPPPCNSTLSNALEYVIQ